MSFTFATVLVGPYEDVTGAPLTGDVVFTPDADLTNGEVTIVSRAFTVSLDDTGSGSAQLVSTEDEGTSPSDALYRVDEWLNGAHGSTYFVSVPSGGVTVNLTDLRQVVPGWG